MIIYVFLPYRGVFHMVTTEPFVQLQQSQHASPSDPVFITESPPRRFQVSFSRPSSSLIV